jgi:hypothetical protein
MISILLIAGFAALGTVTVKMPLFRLAVTASWSTRVEKVKARANSPTDRSQRRYRGWPWAGCV